MSTRVAERPDAEHRAPVLRATGLSKAYRAETMLTQALDGVELTLDAGEFVRVLEHRQGIRISCLEEIALVNGFITAEQCLDLGKALAKSPYGEYVLSVARAAGATG